MGGIIVIDFIDLQLPQDGQILFDKLRDCMSSDRAKHNILPLSKFGLMQITRQRVRPEMHIDTEETCPTCYGKGKIQPSILFIDKLENKIDYLVNQLKVKEFTLYIHPYVNAYINKGLFSIKWKWKRKYGFGVKVIPIQDFAFMQYQFLDKNKNEIDLKEEIETRS